MTATPKLLVAAQDLPNPGATLYTSPAAGRGTWIDKATAVNHDAATHQVTVNHVPAAGAAASSNLVVSSKAVAAGATDTLPELVGKFIPPGASIFALADVAAKVNIEINGREIT
jgi:hypothetical protein